MRYYLRTPGRSLQSLTYISLDINTPCSYSAYVYRIRIYSLDAVLGEYLQGWCLGHSRYFM